MDYNKIVALRLTLKLENDIICTENQSFIIRIDEQIQFEIFIYYIMKFKGRLWNV